MPEKENLMTALMEAPTRLNKFIDACTCGRADKAALTALKKELEVKDTAIEKLEEEIRRKDTEKDNLIHMQKDLQAQIEEIRLLLESHASEASATTQEEMSDEHAASLMQRRARGISGRKRVEQIKAKKSKDQNAVVALQARTRGKLDRKAVEKKAAEGVLPGQSRLQLEEEQAKAAVRMQAKARSLSTRKLVAEKAAAGVLPGQQRLASGSRDGESPVPGEDGEELFAEAGGEYGDELGGGLGGGFSEEASSYFDENESVDSDYDYEESAFESPGAELLAGKLKLAKVYGQEEPPAAEDELEWEVRYFVLYDSARIVHYDDLQDGVPLGDRGLIDLASVSAVEKVLGVNTFVMKGTAKVYLFKLEPHDEVMMRTWIGAISQQLS